MNIIVLKNKQPDSSGFRPWFWTILPRRERWRRWKQSRSGKLVTRHNDGERKWRKRM